jgi:hypothetical protein
MTFKQTVREYGYSLSCSFLERKLQMPTQPNRFVTLLPRKRKLYFLQTLIWYNWITPALRLSMLVLFSTTYRIAHKRVGCIRYLNPYHGSSKYHQRNRIQF